jgi:hypothetical protein
MLYRSRSIVLGLPFHQFRLLFALLFLLFIAAGDVSAQTISNCLTIICPPSFITNCTCDEAFTPAACPLIVTNRCANVQVQVTCDPAPGTPLLPGAHPIQCLVTANGQVARVCDFISTLLDTSGSTMKFYRVAIRAAE